MKTKKEIQDWILENCIDEFGYVDLSDLIFENKTIRFNRIKASVILNRYQEADSIDNGEQKAEGIYNDDQNAKKIDNGGQIANYTISNHDQKAKKIYN